METVTELTTCFSYASDMLSGSTVPGMQGKSAEHLSRGLEYVGALVQRLSWVFLIVTSCRLPKSRRREYFVVFVSMCNGWVLPTLLGIAKEVKVTGGLFSATYFIFSPSSLLRKVNKRLMKVKE